MFKSNRLRSRLTLRVIDGSCRCLAINQIWVGEDMCRSIKVSFAFIVTFLVLIPIIAISNIPFKVVAKIHSKAGVKIAGNDNCYGCHDCLKVRKHG